MKADYTGFADYATFSNEQFYHIIITNCKLSAKMCAGVIQTIQKVKKRKKSFFLLKTKKEEKDGSIIFLRLS